MKKTVEEVLVRILEARDGWARTSESVSGSEIQIFFESASDINFGHGFGYMSDVASMSDFYCRKLK